MDGWKKARKEGRVGGWMGGSKEGRQMEKEAGAPIRTGLPPADGGSKLSLSFQQLLAAAAHREVKQHDGQ